MENFVLIISERLRACSAIEKGSYLYPEGLYYIIRVQIFKKLFQIFIQLSLFEDCYSPKVFSKKVTREKLSELMMHLLSRAFLKILMIFDACLRTCARDQL